MRTSVPSRALVSALCAASVPSAFRFVRSLRRPQAAQDASLRGILALVRGSEQARRFPGLGAVRTAEEYQQAVPLQTAEDYAPAIERQKDGVAAVLTRERVLRFEITGGSSGPSKYVPYTRGLLRELHRSLAPWLIDLFARFPGARRGPGYWSVSPLGAGPPRTHGGTPIGVTDDAAYFPALLQPLLRRVFAVPGGVARLPDVASARYVTLRLLLETPDLALMSAWNPSFLTLLFQSLDGWAERLANDLDAGCCRVPAAAGDDPRRQDCIAAVVGPLSFRALPERARQLRRLARGGTVPIGACWPSLALVSTWTDAQAARSLPALRQRLGEIPIQGKGLLATEAVVSIPVGDAPAPVLAVRGPFMEFIDVGDNGAAARPLLADQLQVGRVYEVVISTAGGLLRYRIGDLVRVEGHHLATPCVRFVGRADQVSDLVGEKLHAARVADAFGALSMMHFGDARVRFLMLAPEWTAPPAYHLYVEAELGDEALAQLADELERRLGENHHYGYARALGQLGPVRAVRVRDGVRGYEARLAALGQRTGVIKPADLHLQPGWLAHFAAHTGADGVARVAASPVAALRGRSP